MSSPNTIISKTINILNSKSISANYFRKNLAHEFLSSKPYPFQNLNQVVKKIVKNFALFPSGQGVYNYLPNVIKTIKPHIIEKGRPGSGNFLFEGDLEPSNPVAIKRWVLDMVQGYLVSQTCVFAIYATSLSPYRTNWSYGENLLHFWEAAAKWFVDGLKIGMQYLNQKAKDSLPDVYFVVDPEENIIKSPELSVSKLIRDFYIADHAVSVLYPGKLLSGYSWIAFCNSIEVVDFNEFYFYFACEQYGVSMRDVCTMIDTVLPFDKEDVNAQSVYAPHILADFDIADKQELVVATYYDFPQPPPVVVDYISYVL